jgi:hypothetical protein
MEVKEEEGAVHDTVMANVESAAPEKAGDTKATYKSFKYVQYLLFS